MSSWWCFSLRWDTLKQIHISTILYKSTPTQKEAYEIIHYHLCTAHACTRFNRHRLFLPRPPVSLLLKMVERNSSEKWDANGMKSKQKFKIDSEANVEVSLGHALLETPIQIRYMLAMMARYYYAKWRASADCSFLFAYWSVASFSISVQRERRKRRRWLLIWRSSEVQICGNGRLQKSAVSIQLKAI